MSHPSQLDYTSAIFDGLTSIWRRLFIFIGLGLLAHFVGGNIYRTPDFVAAVQSRGMAGLQDLRAFDMAWLPLQWAGAIFTSFTSPLTIAYPFLFAAAIVAAFRNDEVPFWVVALLILVQPLDTFLVSLISDPLDGDALAMAALAMAAYLVLAGAGVWAWRHFQEEDY